MSKMEDLFNKLGLTKHNGLYIANEDLWKEATSFPNRVKRLIENRLKPDAFFCFDNKPLILFFDSPEDKEALKKEIWNFNECPIVVIVESNAVEIYNGFKYEKEKKTLELLGGEDKLNDFNYFQLVTGRTLEQYHEHFDYKNRIDYHLLDNIKAVRNVLVEQQGLSSKIANALIGKSVFVRYLIDRSVKMKFESNRSRTWTNEEFCDLLNEPQRAQQFFNYLEDSERGFNGDLFPITSAEYKQIKKEDLQVLRRLLQGENISQGQLSFFELYDFSIIPIEFISNVYELFIGQNNQKEEGAYYTPLFLVDYILSQTVEKHLNSANSYTCKVLDPACGSGIFLVETLRKIIEKYIEVENPEVKSPSFKTAIKKLAQGNIYGVDKDESAVQVAVFSIYLTLLDYLEPPSIETFKFPHLLNSNFFVDDFFDENASFNPVLKKTRLDFILGNPPWKRGKGEKKTPLYVKYLDGRKKQEKLIEGPTINIGNKEIAQAFLLRTSDFSKASTKNALIVTSKVLYNLQSADFRKYFLHHFFIERVFELAPVRREVFDKSNDKATTPACVIFFKYASTNNTSENIIEHISLKPSRFFTLFKIFTINRADFKTVQQSKLQEFDWLWKVLVYGSYLDFNLIRRLKQDYTTIANTVYDPENFIVKQGVKRKDGNKKIDISELLGWNYISTDTKKKNLQRYFIEPNLDKWTQQYVGYIYRNDKGKIEKGIFTPPALLMKDGVTPEFYTIATLLDQKGIFTDNITSVKPITQKAEKSLNNILLLLNSSFASYWALQTASFIGIKQERSHDEEKLSLPFIRIKNANLSVKKIKELKIKEYNNKRHAIFNTSELHKIETELQNELQNIDQKISELLEFSRLDFDLLDYSFNVSVPLIKKKDIVLTPYPFKNSALEEYATLFKNRFKTGLESKGKKFVIVIWHTKQIVGMFFKMIPTSEYTQDIIWEDKQNRDSEIISALVRLSSEKITDRLFVQKDIRGFEKDTFYIFKPNEKRLWHKAIGYLDVNEFADAILKAGRDRQ